MLVKQALIDFFERNDIRCIFQLPGIHTLPLNERLSHQKNMRIITCRHESDMIFMAQGYAKASGRTGVLLVTAGPGLGNIVSGCMEAFHDDIPLFIIHIDVETSELNKGILHGIVEPENIFSRFIKKSYRVIDPTDLPQVLQQAYEEAGSGRRGPTLISVPHTMFGKEISGIAPVHKQIDASDPVPKDRKEGDIRTFLHTFAELLKTKTNPIIVGGAALMTENASLALNDICRNSSIPFLSTTGGKGVVREDNPYAFGNIMRKGVVRDILTSSDLIIAIGTRLRDVDAGRRGVSFRELVHIDIDDQWMDKNYAARLKFAGNVEEALLGIKRIMERKVFRWDLEHLKTLQRQEEARLALSAPGYAVMKCIRDSIPESTTIACDLNIPSYWSEYYLPVYLRNSFLMPRGVSPIFYSIPAAIGARIARPDRPCLALCGDGGALPTLSEIAVMKQYNIPVVIFIYNNNSFAILEDAMIDRYAIQGFMNLRNPDFVKLARAFDIKAKRTKTLKGLARIFRNDVTWDEPFLIEFVHPVSPPPWRNQKNV
ncbi:MAG TPA: thiamine pyrophosphate-binding protein [Syntrophorhabdaceae bacterium]|nr:thiamine pyrophosphate-binding protein [Syntrophorhabdaceae bacterium]